MAASETTNPGTLGQRERRMADTLADRGERLGEKIDSMSATARGAYQRGLERAHVWGDEVGHYVQDQPVRSLLIAAGIGLVLGAILSRR